MSTKAQTYMKLNTLGTNEGLPSNHIYDIVEDNKGFLWLATDNGVSRFDGRYFQNFSVKDGLPSNDVLQVLKTKNGTIWVNSYKQLPAYFDAVKNRFITVENNTFWAEVAKSLLTMIEQPDGSVKFYNNVGYATFNGTHLIDHKLNDNGLSTLTIDKQRVAFTYSTKTLKKGNVHINFVFYLNNRKVDSLHFQTANAILHRTLNDNEIYLLSERNIIYKITVRSVAPLLYSIDSVITPGSNYWYKFSGNYLNIVNTKGTAYIMDKKPMAPLHIITTQLAINCAYIDKHKNIWIGTLDKGLLYYSQSGIQNIVTKAEFINPNFLSLAVNNKGEVFAGNYYGEVLQSKGNIQIKHNIPKNKLSSWMRKIICTNGKVVVINDAAYCTDFKNSVGVLNRQGTYASLKSALALNDSIVIFGSTGGLIELNLRTKRTKPLNSIDDRALHLVKADNNTIYYIGPKGLYKYQHDRDISTFIPFDKESEEKKLTTLAYAPNGTLWASTTTGGLLVFKHDKVIATINDSIGLPENISSMLAHNNKIWIGSKTGISIIEYSKTGPTFRHTLTNLSKTDGLPSNIINNLAFYSDTIYAATENGIAKIPANYRSAKFEISPELTSVKINQVNTPISSNYTLESHQNNIMLQFSGIELGGHFKNLQYALNDKRDWNTLDGNTLNIQLNNGENNLYIRAVDINNHVSTYILKILFFIKTPFYKAKWFWVLMAFVSTGLVFWWLNRRKLNKQKIAFEQQVALEQQRNKITADLHDDIGASLSSLQVNSAVANQLIDRDTKQAQRILGKIENQSKDLADKIGDIIWSMKPGKDEFMTMSSRIKNFANDILSATDIDYWIQVEPLVDKKIQDITFRKNIVLITKEAINNAAKYSKASKVSILLELIDNKVKLSISDNGVGFEANENLGNGLANMRKRTEELQGVFSIASVLKKGTTISAVIPLVP